MAQGLCRLPNLANDLAGGEIAAETLRTSGTERTVQSAANLRRDA
jgi:hypothetical protein